MMSRARILALVALALVGGASFWLRGLRDSARLGNPGVKLSSVPTLEEDSLRPVRTNSIALPTELPGYAVRVENIGSVVLATLPGDTTFGRRTFRSRDGAFQTECNVVMMGTDRTSIHRPEVCLPSQGWKLVRRTATNIVVRRPSEYRLPVRRFDMEFRTTVGNRPVVRSGVYVFWFVADGLLTDSHAERQWLMMRDLVLRGNLQRWAYVSFFTDCAPGEEDATFARIAEVAAAAVPEFQLTDGRAL